ncbi:MAG TPA: glycosyltransferase 87 family protein, partial [Myxococcaceae bacterium]|nr:glycosyltransferase 87 family protein [Myxococcaceae bacterium]
MRWSFRFGDRWIGVAMACVVAFGWLLRAYPLFAVAAPRIPVDYDDGVYFSAAALLWHGALPYRDFTFVHPPGILLFLSPSAALARAFGPALGLIASRWMTTAVGAVNIALVGRLALRWQGPIAGVAAALVYAMHPEISNYERGPYLEPALNLACLLAASFWLRGASGGRWLAAGAACGLACAVKSWGVLWLAASMASLPESRRGRAAAQLFLGAVGAFSIAALPFAFSAGSELFHQSAWFHWIRPPDGASPSERLPMILDRYRTILPLVGLGGLTLALRGRSPLAADDRARSRYGRFWAVAFLS